jgi:hypothetical protein
MIGCCAVAMLTDLLISLAEQRPALRTSVVAVFIANEENSTFVGIGVDQLAKDGYLDSLKAGPLFWIDAADSQPCIGRSTTCIQNIEIFSLFSIMARKLCSCVDCTTLL